jgi:DNA (cytosine-5)-methyltransferase 1
LEWEGEAIYTEGKKTFYKAVHLNDGRLTAGDYVSVKPDNPKTPLYIAKIEYLYEDKSGNKMFHAHWF